MEPQFVITALDMQRNGLRCNLYYAVDVSAINRALPRLQKKYGSLYTDWRIDRYDGNV